MNLGDGQGQVLRLPRTLSASCRLLGILSTLAARRTWGGSVAGRLRLAGAWERGVRFSAGSALPSGWQMSGVSGRLVFRHHLTAVSERGQEAASVLY